MFDHEVAIWRPTVTYGDLKEEIRTFVQILAAPGTPNAIVNRPKAPTLDTGPGLTPVGTRRLYMAPATEVLVRDLIELVEGPDAGMILEVDEPPTRPRGHHVQLDCRLFNGKLPGGS